MKLSNTSQRRVIIEELRKLKTHPTADELYTIVKQRLPQISLATVYRNLDLLAEIGDVLRLEMAGRQKRYDGDTSLHYHLRCKECGAVEDLSVEHPERMKEVFDKMVAGRVSDVKIEFDGYCNACYISRKAARLENFPPKK